MDSQSEQGERLLTGYTGHVLLTLSVGYLCINLGFSILSPLLPDIMAALDITAFQAGVALTLLTAAQALGFYPGGRSSDVLSRKTILMAGAASAILGFLLLSVVTHYVIFLLATAAIGLGAGLYWIALRASLADLFVERRGQAFGLQDSISAGGPILAAGVAVVAVSIGRWNVIFPVLVFAVLMFTVLIHRKVKEPYETGWVAMDVRPTMKRIFADPKARWLFVAYSAMVFCYTSTIGFVPTFLQAERAFSPLYSSLGFAALSIGSMTTMPIAGFLGDRFGYRPIATGGIFVAIGGLVLLVTSSPMPLILAGAFVFSLGAFAFPPVVQAHLMTIFPDASMGGDYGIFKSLYSIIGSAGPIYVGIVAGAMSYAAAFTGLLACLGLAAAILHFRM